MSTDIYQSIDWFRPEMNRDEESRVLGVIQSGFVNDGPVTNEFEANIAELIGVKHCVAVTSGTVAISLALMAVGVGAGDEVIVPDFTFIATANAVRMTGADVRLVDIDPNRLTIDADKLIAAIGPKTRAIVTVDVNGRGADYQCIESICQERSINLITDSAEGLGSFYDGKPLGSFGDAGCFSFSPNKLITTGQGGMIATNNTSVYNRLLELKDQGRPKRGTGGDDLHPSSGFNFKFTDIQAAVGLAQFDKLESRCIHAQQRDLWYKKELQNIPEVVFPSDNSEQNGEVHAWTDVLLDKRQEVISALRNVHIDCRAFWYPLHTQNSYYNDRGCFDNAIVVSEQGLWLPSTFDIDYKIVQRVCDVIKDVYS